MRARYPLVFVAAAAGVVACIPHPAQDFEDYADRANKLANVGDGGSFEAAAPPSEAVTGLYYGACLSQLAFYQLTKVFNFYVESTFTPESAGGGTLSITLQALKLSSEQGPPVTVSKDGITGEKQGAPTPAPNVAAADGRYTIELGTITVPGDANPITGRVVIIEQSKLTGFVGKEGFCARLNGNVTQPIQVALEPEKNICQFVPVKEGDATPTFTLDDFQPGSCPF